MMISTTSAPNDAPFDTAAADTPAATAGATDTSVAALTTAAAAEATEAAAPVTFVGERPRSRAVTLDWPVSFNGVSYSCVVLRRLTASEVAGFMKQLAELPVGARYRVPIYFDTAGAPIPSEVLDALDDDDQLALEKAAQGFLPRRFQADPESTTDQQPGAPIAP